MRNISCYNSFVVQFLYCRTNFFPILNDNVGLELEPEPEPKYVKKKVEQELEPKLNNFGSTTLIFSDVDTAFKN